MIALIDTLFYPILSWISSLRDTLLSARVPLSQSLPLDSLFSPVAMLSPSWQLVISNIFMMVFIYLIIYIVVNGVGLLETFRNAVKWW